MTRYSYTPMFSMNSVAALLMTTLAIVTMNAHTVSACGFQPLIDAYGGLAQTKADYVTGLGTLGAETIQNMVDAKMGIVNAKLGMWTSGLGDLSFPSFGGAAEESRIYQQEEVAVDIELDDDDDDDDILPEAEFEFVTRPKNKSKSAEKQAKALKKTKEADPVKPKEADSAKAAKAAKKAKKAKKKNALQTLNELKVDDSGKVQKPVVLGRRLLAV